MDDSIDRSDNDFGTDERENSRNLENRGRGQGHILDDGVSRRTEESANTASYGSRNEARTLPLETGSGPAGNGNRQLTR